jgi:hypothetical protein
MASAASTPTSPSPEEPKEDGKAEPVEYVSPEVVPTFEAEDPKGPAPSSVTPEKPSQKGADTEEAYAPTPVPLVLFAGVWYLLCLDIVALFIKPLERWAMSLYPPGFFPDEKVDAEDDWKPSATTIPFGPYLAAGALICILFAAAIEKGMHDYFYGPSQPEGTVQGGQLPPQ